MSLTAAPCEPEITFTQASSPAGQHNTKDRLKDFCKSLKTHAVSKCEKKFVANLDTSCVALNEHMRDAETKMIAPDAQERLMKYQGDCKSHFENINNALLQCVADNASCADKIGLDMQHSSRLSPSFWLERLHRDQFDLLPEPWKLVIVEYGLAITQLHRAQRLLALSGKPVDLAEELSYIGHSNWNPLEQPETLLLEAESGILVRKEQALIASHMISPKNGNNAVLQLQMGQGKSTVLTPLVATASTDKKK